MGKALKKGQDYTLLNHTKWAAWGVVDIEKLERMQRRNYINHVRKEFEVHGCILNAGGSSERPCYGIAGELLGVTNGEGAFKEICLAFLRRYDPDHVQRGEDQ